MESGPGGGDVVGLVFGGGMCLFSILMFAVSIAGLIFWIFQLIDVARRQFPDQNMKIVWLLVVILGSFIGALIYHFAGKPQGTLPGS
jgi:hypothetical protein